MNGPVGVLAAGLRTPFLARNMQALRMKGGFGRDVLSENDENPFDDTLHRGLTAMSTERFWIGTLMLTGLAMAVILALSPAEAQEYGTVEGTVTYHGCPVHRGAIFFLAEGQPLEDAVCAWIDNDGHYRCDPSWRRDREAKRFRIFVVLNPGDYPPLDLPTAEAAAGDEDDGYPGLERTDERARPRARVIRASLRSPDLETPTRPVVRRRPPRFSNPRTTDLAVRLGPEPARVDVALED
jgi:hypothetical protein